VKSTENYLLMMIAMKLIMVRICCLAVYIVVKFDDLDIIFLGNQIRGRGGCPPYLVVSRAVWEWDQF